MLDSVILQCPHCRGSFNVSVPYIQGQIKAMRILKSFEVAHQLHEKRGPFYDKWLAAMEARGEQMRCKDCYHLDVDDKGVFCGLAEDYASNQNPGVFACSKFELDR